MGNGCVVAIGMGIGFIERECALRKLFPTFVDLLFSSLISTFF